MNGDEDGAEALRDVAAPLLACDDPSAAPAANDLVVGLTAYGDRLVFDAQRAKRFQGVRAQIQTRADFIKLGGLFVDHGFDPAMLQR